MLPLLLWLPIAPILVLLAVGLGVFEAMRRSEVGSRLLSHQVWRWLARGVLVAVFAVCLVDLVKDTVILT